MVKALVGMNSNGGKVLTASINLVTLKDWVKVCNLVLPFTTMGKMEVFNTNSVEVKVSVMVFKAGVAPLDEAMTTACKVSMLEDKSTPVYSGPDEVKMFSGAGMVSVWKIGFEEVGAMVGLKVSVNVLKSKGCVSITVKRVKLRIFQNNNKDTASRKRVFMKKQIENP